MGVLRQVNRLFIRPLNRPTWPGVVLAAIICTYIDLMGSPQHIAFPDTISDLIIITAICGVKLHYEVTDTTLVLCYAN